MVSGINFQGKFNKEQVKQNKKANTAGNIAAITVSSVGTGFITAKANGKLMDKFLSINDKVDFSHTKQLAEKMIAENNLTAKGVTMNLLSEEQIAEKLKQNKHISTFTLKEAKQKLLNSPKVPNFAKKILNNEKLNSFVKKSVQMQSDLAVKGTLSAYLPDKSVNAPQARVLDIFHEIGHAINHNGKFGKVVAKSRQFGPLLGGIAFLLALGAKKSDNEEGASTWGKIKSFAKNNIGLITLAGFVPTLLDEGSATYKGIKFLKNNNMDKAAINVFKKRIGIGFATYALVAGATAIGSKLAFMAKDKVVDKLEYR